MYISIADQTVVFLQAILFGAGVGLYYDLLRAIRRKGSMFSLLTVLLDGVFWLASIIAFTLFVLLVADGEGRSYVLAGLAGGLILYFLTLSPIVLAILGKVLSLLWIVFAWLLRITSIPVHVLRRLAGSRTVQKIIHKFSTKNFKKTLPFFRE